ncbi:MAG TPA: hypothetical protein DCZ98_06765, partial [Cryomorphaceae bacterium]|nr:hypothetical protein [Cryomorphaceae bacterium]
MKNGVLLLGISYALLTACGTNVSLTENYFEDENFYNPSLPSPQFALESLKSNDIYSELDYDQFWDTTGQVMTSKTGVNTGRSNRGGYGISTNSSFIQTNSFGWGQGLGYGIPHMFGSTWYNPWQLGPSNYWNEFMFGGYGHNSLNPYPYGFSNNGYGYNNGFGYNNG